MPNWCFNEVVISGSAADIKKIYEKFDCANNKFSFQSYMPVPKDLLHVQDGSLTIKGVKYDKWYQDPDTEECIPLTEENKHSLMTKYGATCAFDWRMKHWGTKWDAQIHSLNTWISEDGSCGDIMVNFDTPWGPPEMIYEQLVKEFPDVNFDWFYKEPGMRIAGWLGED